VIRFATFELDLKAAELRKGGVKLKLTGQPFQILAILLENPGQLVTREELQKRLWPDTFVDVEHNLNAAINKIREVLSDSAENPRFVETLPRRGYRFIAPTNGVVSAPTSAEPQEAPPRSRLRTLLAGILGTVVLLAVAGWLVYKRQAPAGPHQRTLTRLTFDPGLQIEPTWAPDSRYIAYTSSRGGKFDIWVQAVSGSDPVQVTKGPGNHWQPNWSPDGKYIAYRSEQGDGGLFIVPPLGGTDFERRISSFGYYPRWSPDSSQILFRTQSDAIANSGFYTVGLDDRAPEEILKDFAAQHGREMGASTWHPDGNKVSVVSENLFGLPQFWTIPISGGAAIRSDAPKAISDELARMTAEQAQGELWFQVFGHSSFSWAPSGRAVYFDRALGGAKNIWKMSVDPASLQITVAERLTTGPGPDDGESVSPDGKRLAFTAKTEHVRVWMMPFDAATGRLTGAPQPVTPPGMTATEHSLSRDGSKLVFAAIRGGKKQLWEESLADQHAARVVADDYIRETPRWSPDGSKLVYTRHKYGGGDEQLMI
jgi:Tol biopolymer transport system component/DNA-binding winged helix-turn-helix (wHTH) protein